MSNATQLTEHYNKNLQSQKTAEELAVKAIVLLQKLAVNDVQVTLFGQLLSDKSINQIIALHKTQQTIEHNISLQTTVDALQELIDSNATGVRADVGQLFCNADASVVLSNMKNLASGSNEATDVVLYGFGRIGRILTRLLMQNPASDKGLQLKGIVVRPAASGDLQKRASLLSRDSVHGTFDGSVVVDEANNGIIVNGRFIQVIYASKPSDIDYTSYGINNAIIVDNTGIWTDEDGLGQHLKAKGASKVLLTAPAKGDIKNVVYNVNNDVIGSDDIVSAASCTTNAITCTLKVLNDTYGIDTGHVETIHAFTNDQNLIDNYHKKDRRGRSAALNMVITSTGAAKAVGKALPELNGKLTGNAIRVPTPNVSMAILNLNLATAPESVDELNEFLHGVANSAKWQNQIGYSDSTEAVSTDFVGSQTVAVIDAQATIVTDNHATIYIWYDNEVGYSTQVLRVATQMAGINYTQLPTA